MQQTWLYKENIQVCNEIPRIKMLAYPISDYFLLII